MADKVYRLTTPCVLDGLSLAQAGGDELGADKYTLVGMCIDKKLKDVLLDPPRSGSTRQSAPVILTTVLGTDEFMVQHFRLVLVDELFRVTLMMTKLHVLSRGTRFNLSREQPDWSTPESGLGSLRKRRCRRLSHNPPG